MASISTCHTKVKKKTQVNMTRAKKKRTDYSNNSPQQLLTARKIQTLQGWVHAESNFTELAGSGVL